MPPATTLGSGPLHSSMGAENCSWEPVVGGRVGRGMSLSVVFISRAESVR